MPCGLEVHEKELEAQVGIASWVQWVSTLGVMETKRSMAAEEVPQMEAKKVKKPSLRSALGHGTSVQVDAIHEEDVEECEIDLDGMQGSSMTLG